MRGREEVMKILIVAAVLSLGIGTAIAACPDRVDVAKVTGIDSEKLVEVICGASVMRVVLESAEVQNSAIGPNGEDLFAKRLAEVKAGKGGSDEETIWAASAKSVRINFRAGGILTISFEKLREKIEQYMADTYIALFSQPVPLWSVRIAALYPLSGGKDGVVYGTQVLNRDGRYDPGSLPQACKVWRLNRSLRPN